MANQRKETRKQVGAYLDETLVEAVKKTGMDNSEFLELTWLRWLLSNGKITAAKVRELASEDRVKSATILRLQQEGLLK